MAEETNISQGLINEVAGEESKSLFADEVESDEDTATEEKEFDTTEESDDETEDEDSGDSDESEDDADEDADTDEEEDEDSEAEVIASNLRKALHAEREKRKETRAQLEAAASQIEYESTRADDATAAYKELVDLIKETGLDEVIDVPALEALNPEVMEARKMKQAQENQKNVEKFYQEVKDEALSLAPEYKNVNLGDENQGIIMTNMVTSAVLSGMDREAAVEASFKVLDGLVESITKQVLAKRQPPVKPKPKPKARTKQSKKSGSTIRQNIDKGDMDAVFGALAEGFVKGGQN